MTRRQLLALALVATAAATTGEEDADTDPPHTS